MNEGCDMQKRRIVKWSNKLLRRFGIELVSAGLNPEKYPDFTPAEIALIERVRPYTMTSMERIHALHKAVRYVIENNISGAFVECGVWRGGSMMAVALTLLDRGVHDRALHLFDTFEGMTLPTETDRSFDNEQASVRLQRDEKENKRGSAWCYAQQDYVEQVMASTDYPAQNVHFARGKVEDTLPEQAPENIAVLRLDTDWYESTKHEMIHLFPRLVRGGVLIVDDYGHWKGARKAVDEYTEQNDVKIYLNRIDYTGRVGIKL